MVRHTPRAPPRDRGRPALTGIVDLILAGVVLEAAALLAYRRITGRGPGVAILANLAAGACLLAALRAALGGAGWVALCACLLAGLVAHLADLRVRWTR